MKTMIIILLLSIGAGNKAQAQILKDLKTKAKTAVDNSVDRSTSKIVDKGINNTADNVTDTALNKAGRKIHSLFKKKNKGSKTTESTAQPTAPAGDSVAIKPPNQN